LRELNAIPLEAIITDAGYVSILDLRACEQRQVKLVGPVHENDYTKDKDHAQEEDQTGATKGKGRTRRKGKGKGRTEAQSQPMMSKDQFTWDPQEQTYRCPQGHTMPHVKQQHKPRRQGESVVIHQYQCPAACCQQCPLASRCVKDPSKGRTVMRTEGEELLEAHRLWMATPEAKALKKQRGQVIERGFGDSKQHRNLRRFHGRGLGRAKVEFGLVVLAQNILMLHRLRQKAVTPLHVAA
jgi:hypothetical protein